jgi:hypothetical protein
MDLLDLHGDGVNLPDLHGGKPIPPSIREDMDLLDIHEDGVNSPDLHGDGVNSTPFLMERGECPHQEPLGIQHLIGEVCRSLHRA